VLACGLLTILVEIPLLKDVLFLSLGSMKPPPTRSGPPNGSSQTWLAGTQQHCCPSEPGILPDASGTFDVNAALEPELELELELVPELKLPELELDPELEPPLEKQDIIFFLPLFYAIC